MSEPIPTNSPAAPVYVPLWTEQESMTMTQYGWVSTASLEPRRATSRALNNVAAVFLVLMFVVPNVVALFFELSVAVICFFALLTLLLVFTIASVVTASGVKKVGLAEWAPLIAIPFVGGAAWAMSYFVTRLAG